MRMAGEIPTAEGYGTLITGNVCKIETKRVGGVTSVPTFLVAGQYVVSGAQPPDLWAKVIAELTPPAESKLN